MRSAEHAGFFEMSGPAATIAEPSRLSCSHHN
jgi:hypothetical protein